MKENRLKVEIIENSKTLFEKQGYSATTMRQIAQESSCTAGSLYYFFEGGKAEILRAVIRSYGLDPAHSLTWTTETDSLEELVGRLVVELPAIYKKVSKQLTWLMLEFNRLGDDEKEVIRSFPVAVFDAVFHGVMRHVNDPQKGRQVSWLIGSALYGYGEMYERIGHAVGEEFGIEEMGKSICTAVKLLAAA